MHFSNEKKKEKKKELWNMYPSNWGWFELFTLKQTVGEISKKIELDKDDLLEHLKKI